MVEPSDDLVAYESDEEQEESSNNGKKTAANFNGGDNT
jgi:hypothetical protein